MNSLVVLYRILRKFYRELECIEKFFLCTYIIDMATYCFLFIGSLILTGHFEIDFLFILILGFPIISGIIMFYGKTVYHGLAFLGVHSFPVFGGIAYFYTQYFNCRDHTLKCDASPTFYAIIIKLFLFHFFYLRIWPLVYEFKHSRHDEIKEMHAIYEVQFPLFHAQIIMIGLLLVAYLVGICGIDLVALTKRRISSRKYLSIFKDEKHYLMFIVYVGNFIQALLLYFDMASFCKQFKSLAKLDSTLQCFQYNTEICTFLLYACLCWIVLALSTWNTIRCHKNFGKNMSDYITYEPTPPEFESGRKLVKRESSVPEHSHIV
ncbi:hypothetical protein GLOIN_2v1717641 [Rhizophagus irregularis DAOM 181602=DAOM 197198]|uniref:Uncharacterized protein n=1 Tax=Rhizophagus irregularis (strain DAOM 181602 / DAOM 197198 / MUCL 43194) TaxID=747089 RepID=A0A2P4P3K5_RHIID|nr:hypothetical protein GLOIN_2v1717641 [Rhizophagus irregularis DAOM 181602=DAOM 197198]POG59950.1 hypothetical protein GLOIN_2v1717641 [Rhizophagus irregularis DAOM 181602=DAOM 197198]|eukprot:XP_025166816.1 hypothetical protein GLOIN_2v1717641 [Rhizophagus irregularis DAOM 181602=DAOM 197198]